MSCIHKFVNSECTTVCLECGITFPKYITPDVKKYTEKQPLWVGYNKSNRFRNMLLALFRPLTHSTIPGKMILHLQKFPKFESVEAIFECMKTAVCCRDKKYNSMHLYAVMFCKNYKILHPPPSKNNIRSRRRFYSFGGCTQTSISEQEVFFVSMDFKSIAEKIQTF